MANVDLKFKGLQELSRFLEQLEPKVRRNVARNALRAGAKVLQRRAKAAAPVRTGQLRASIRVSTSLQRGVPTASIKAGGKRRGKRTVFYAHMVEFGTKSHLIEARKAKALFFGGRFFANVSHPGFTGRPYMRPAIDGGAREAVVAIAENMRRTLMTKHGLDASGVDIAVDITEEE